MTYKLETNDPVETPDEQKVVVKTTSTPDIKKFTIKERKIEIESIDLQITALQIRKQELLDEINEVCTKLNLTVIK